MNKTDLLEIKKLFKYPDASFEGIEYCDVRSCEAEGESPDDRLLFCGNGKFLTRDDEEQKAFLTLLSKAFSFSQNVSTEDVEVPSELKKLFSSFVGNSSSKVPTDALMKELVSKYGELSAYSVVLFRGSYDIPIKDVSKTKTGESDEVYNYFALMICPVKAEKTGLSPDIGSENIIRSEAVRKLQPPVLGLLYPSFTERSADDETCFVCAKSEKEREFISSLFGASVKEPLEKVKAQIKGLPAFKEPLPEDMTEKISEVYSDLKAGDVDSLKESIKKLDEFFSGNEQVNNIDAALLDKRSEIESEEVETAQDIENKEDRSSVVVERITERDINGKKYFLVPKDLLPEDILERLLSL